MPIFLTTHMMYFREMLGKAVAWSMEMRPERRERNRKKLIALASKSKILSDIWRLGSPPAWMWETVWEPRSVRGMAAKEEMHL